MKKKIIFTVGLFILCFVYASSAQAQTSKFIICQEKQVWLASEAKAVKFGQCGNENWLVKFEIGETQTDKPSEKKLEVLKLFQNISKNKVEPVKISQTDLAKIIAEAKNLETVFIKHNELPDAAHEIIAGISKPNALRFIITSGVGYPGGYDESYRITVELFSSNPTIAEILEEFKKLEKKRNAGTKDEWLLGYQHSYYLETEDMKQKLDPTRTIADYDLKDGAIMRVFTGVR